MISYLDTEISVIIDKTCKLIKIVDLKKLTLLQN